jgi:gliding motility-associatede transport system auxiliary component
MASEPSSPPSFSRKSKWGIALNVALLLPVALAIVVMLNYLGHRYYHRFYASTNTRIELSPRTLSVLNSLTNEVQVTIYYDREDSLYSNIAELLKEYHARNPAIKVRTVDYYRDPGAAQEVKLKYDLGATTNRNFIIFEQAGRTRIVSGTLLANYDFPLADPSKQTDPTKPTFDKKLTTFTGEMLFTPAIYTVSNPKPLKAYFLRGHREKSFADAEDDQALFKFAGILRQNAVTNESLQLLGTNGIPADCNLLVIAGPIDPLSEQELEPIDQYLRQGGRLFALFTVLAERKTGLEQVLAKWGVDVSQHIVKEPNNTVSGADLKLLGTSLGAHPITKPFYDSFLHFVLPRSISRIEPPARADVPVVTELVFSSPESLLADSPSTAPRAYAVLVAVESNSKSAAPERGPTRILVAGDSIFIGNQMIESAANWDFANACVNWLLERSVLLEGLGPKHVNEYRLIMTRGQMRSAEWILLGAIPGGVLLLGGLVWFRRRK